MANKIRCPQCSTINPVGVGVAGVYCTGCGTYIQLDGGSDQPWATKGFLERLVERFSSPKGMVWGSIALLLLFVGFWGLLHLQSGEPAKQVAAPAPVVSDEQSSGTNETPTPAAPQIALAPSNPKPNPVRSAIPATAPTTQVASTRPVPHPLPPPVDSVDDKQVGEAIDRGAHYLLSQFDPATHAVKADALFPNGENALCVYALLQCNDAITDPDLAPTSDVMRPVIETLKGQPPDKLHETYGWSLRANALALLDRATDRPTLEKDVRSLLSLAHAGAFGYGPAGGPSETIMTDWDNSNSQYGVLGVWAGEEVGMTIPNAFWQAVQKHWTGVQNQDGSFGYSPRSTAGTLSMTAAGIASLCIAHDNLGSPATIGGDPRPTALIKALEWINHGDNVLGGANGPHFVSYTRYGVVRAGLASGYKFFGKHDWYTELVMPEMQNQRQDGSLGDPIDTSFTLLALARGRHPILFNKLTVDGVTLDHPRDAANLARFATRELEHTFNAQIVPIDTDWKTWNESPVLYLAGATAPVVTDEQCDQLRNFVRAGGLLFTHADGNSKAFNDFAAQLAKRLFPEYAYQDLPADHPLYSVLFKLNPPPPLSGVSNGARLLMVNSPRDLAKSWDIHDWKKVEPVYRIGLNIFLYAAGNRDFRNRLDTNYVAAPKRKPEEKPEVTLNVARLRYSGNWDPEPYAWTRFSRMFEWKTSFAANVQPTDIADLKASGFPAADLTGTEAHQFSADELVVLRRYVQEGGLLLIDSCGGATGFASSQTGFVAELVSGVQPRPIGANHPVVRGNGPCMDPLAEVIPRIPGTAMPAPGIISFGRGHIVITPLDLTDALLGSHTLGIKGYHPKYAEPLVRNLLLWAYNGQSEQ